MTGQDVWHQSLLSVRKDRDAAEEEVRSLVDRGLRWQLLLEREIRSRWLLEPGVLGTLSRYERNIWRTVFEIRREIQNLQASESAIVIPSLEPNTPS